MSYTTLVKIVSLPAFVFICLTTMSAGRELYPQADFPLPAGKISANTPYVEFTIHDINKLGVTITNMGSIGTGYIGEEVTGVSAPSCNYPYPTNLKYMFAGTFWIGAVVGRDTLVSVGADGWQYTREMWPDPYPMGEIENHSIIDPEDEEAVSEQDYIAVYTDTVTNPGFVSIDPTDGRPHRPLNIEIMQRSYGWSYAYAEDFILFDYSIKNIGRRELEKVYMGLYLDAEVTPSSGNYDDFTDDICGFRREVASFQGCGFIDTINVAWVADNDGRPGVPPPCPSNFDLTSVLGMRVVRTPSDSLEYSFNWWISNPDASLDFGPRMAGTPDDPFRDFGGFLGTPEGDKNKYYIMRHKEFDYDQLFSAVDQTADGWLPPSTEATNFANGYDTRFLLSFGPFTISPGEVLPVSFALMAGADFHTRCEAYDELFQPNPTHPEFYYDYLDFSDLGKNAMWSSWIYDNPGVDTDGDQINFGKFRICAFDSTVVFDTIAVDPELIIDTVVTYLDADTMWYEGDGVPDFRGASPPPAPELRVVPRIDEYNRGELQVRWNGFLSETTRDIFSNEMDFEGYRVYMSLTSRVSDYVILSSYDIEDFNKYIWNSKRRLWELKDPPFTLDSLQALYPNIGDDPAYYDRDNIYNYMDSAFYFARQDWNRSNYRDTNSIHKIYPDEAPPTVLNLDSAAVYYPEELTDEGRFKYFEYGFTIRNLLPSQLYYVSVTAFDYGAPASGLQSLESSPSTGSQKSTSWKVKALTALA